MHFIDRITSQYWSRGISCHAQWRLIFHLLSYRRVFYVHVHSKHKSPDCHKFKGMFLFSDACRLCFQHLVLIAAIFAGFGRKPENASGVQGMPPINAKRRATFVLFQQVNQKTRMQRKKRPKP